MYKEVIMNIKVIHNQLPSNKIPSDMNAWFAQQAGMQMTVQLKDNTSMNAPVLLAQRALWVFNDWNYFRMTLDADRAKYRYYYVTDVVSVTNDIVEIHAELDILRSFSFINNQTDVRLAYTTRVTDWVPNLDDMRWQPDRTEQWVYKQGHGDMNHDVIKGLRRHENIPIGFNAVAGGFNDTSNDGVYLIKWWWGQTDTTGSNYAGIAYGMFNKDNFRSFVYQVGDFIANNPSAILSGVHSFTEFIISAKYFPSLRLLNNSTVGLDGTAGTGAAPEAGYVHIQADPNTGLVVGGLCTVTNIDCYLRLDNAGYLYNHLSEEDNGDSGFIIDPFGDLDTVNNNRMEFLCSSRWLSCTVNTPIGVTNIPLDSLKNRQRIRVRSMIDLEAGTMTMRFMKMDSNEVLNELKGAIYLDVMNAFTHVQSMGERAFSAAIGAAPSIASGVLSNGLAVGGGMAAMNASYQVMTSSAVVNHFTSSYSNDLGNMALNTNGNMSIKYFSVYFSLYLNKYTPIWDPHVWGAQDTVWDAQYLQTNYMNWCEEHEHGYPSNLYKDLLSCITPSADGIYIKCSEVDKISIPNGFTNPHIEDTIRSALLNGVIIFSATA